ncbi:MAG: DUF1015 family protein [Mycobacteriales bacterium]
MTSSRAAPERPPLRVAPFRALRFAASGERLARLLCPPYDVIDDAGVTELEHADPHNVVRLILPRADRASAQDRYERAATTLRDWRGEGVLARDPEPALYAYEMSTEHARTLGILAAVGLAPSEAGVILPHENTMAGPVADRLALTAATRANLEPIYLVYNGGGATADLLTRIAAGPVDADATTPDGVRHRLWAVTDESSMRTVAADLAARTALIADGHHRYATYLRYQADRAASAHPGDAGRPRDSQDQPWDFGLAFLVDARTSGAQVEAIHRVIPGLPLADAVRSAAAGFATGPVDGPLEHAVAALRAAGAHGTALLLTDGDGGHLLTQPAADALDRAVPRDHAAAWRELDVTICHRLLFTDLWGLQDREGVVDFEHDAAVALQRSHDTHGVAVLLNPTRVEQVAAVAAAGEKMPRKSTLFTPKPATGLVLRPLDD